MSMTYRLKKRFPDRNEAHRDANKPGLFARTRCGDLLPRSNEPILDSTFQPKKRSLTQAIWWGQRRW